MLQRPLPALIASLSLVVACSSDNPGAGGGGAGGAISQDGGGGGAGGAASGASGSTGSGAGAGGGGTSGSGSAQGSSTASSGGGSGGASPTPSAGCDKDASQPLAQWVAQPDLNIESVDRKWWVWLPAKYDPTRAYPVVFLFHGCSSGDNNVPMQRQTGEDAILVRGVGVSSNTCWDASANGPDVAFFDRMLDAVLQDHCADASRVFAAGYSSGAWLINTLECRRGDRLRAAGSVAGGAVNPRDCVGQVARIFVHDANDRDNDISGSVVERDRLLEANHCDAEREPVPEAPSPCVRYQGCDEGYPVIWCETSGQGHDRQDALAPAAFWGLFTEL
ncbi:alpha/beta hydrolase family esterase [Sorangium sp. So ce362]|uniref:alpha/beta hydrolase family esterase n=1 Tax=Sorangium sp. So ce362 TaxID=3133303 RepID=UPI003F5E15B5